MPRRLWTPPTLVVAFLAVVGLGPSARAEHAKIVMDVVGPSGQETAYVDQTPPDSGKRPRPVLRVRAGDPVRIQYVLTNVYPHKTLKDAVVHFYVAKQEEVGQKALPNLEVDGVLVVESAFDLDFRPGGKAGGRQRLTIDEPGVYLIRVESGSTQSDHEHFAAMDLVVEEKP